MSRTLVCGSGIFNLLYVIRLYRRVVTSGIRCHREADRARAASFGSSGIHALRTSCRAQSRVRCRSALHVVDGTLLQRSQARFGAKAWTIVFNWRRNRLPSEPSQHQRQHRSGACSAARVSDLLFVSARADSHRRCVPTRRTRTTRPLIGHPEQQPVVGQRHRSGYYVPLRNSVR